MLTDLLAAYTGGAQRHKDAIGAEALAAFDALSVTDQLKLLDADLAKLSKDQQGEFVRAVATSYQRPFVAIPGPQTWALYSEADELLYGGAAGGGKSRLLLGCAALYHKRALILRRQSTELDGLVAELKEMLGHDGWRSEGGGGTYAKGNITIRLGGCREPDDWRHFAGRARDYLGLDEAAEFLEEQVSSLIGWVRSTDPAQRCRIILASNPPRGGEGLWVIEWFAPWLDPGHERPARAGELRWFVRANSRTLWVDGPGEYEFDGETYTARSRTFIPALLDDNPFLARTAYRATLQSMPEPLRSQLLKGDFLAGREDDAWQIIPSDWIQKARLRWSPDRPQTPMTAIGVDVAQGGPDRTVLAPRYGKWFAPVKAYDGATTPDGISIASHVFTAMRDGCTVIVDIGGGWGADAFAHLKKNIENDDQVVGYLGLRPTIERSVNGLEEFANERAKDWWRLREALDPETGADIALPPDPELAAELAMPRRVPEKKKIQIETKTEINKRLGRSPDKADAVVMCWAYGTERAAQRHAPERLQTMANVGHARAKRWARGR